MPYTKHTVTFFCFVAASLQRKRAALKSESGDANVNMAASDSSMATPLDELKKRLKDASDNFSPSSPSLCVYSINTHGNQWYCLFVCVCVCVCVSVHMVVCPPVYYVPLCVCLYAHMRIILVV